MFFFFFFFFFFGVWVCVCVCVCSGFRPPLSPLLCFVIFFCFLGLGYSVWCASDWWSGGRRFDPRRVRQHSFIEIDNEIFSTVIFSLPLIQVGQSKFLAKEYAQVLLNRLEDYACPSKSVIGKLTALHMTLVSWLGRKTSTQTNNSS